jgi:23S rRNA (guanine745-N1)-methyltransferase
VLRRDGTLVVATPQADHLGEVVDRLGLLSVDEDKPHRLRAALEERFVPVQSRDVRWTMRLSRSAVRALVQMGPSARHITADATVAGVDALDEPVQVTGAVTVSTYRPQEF